MKKKSCKITFNMMKISQGKQEAWAIVVVAPGKIQFGKEAGSQVSSHGYRDPGGIDFPALWYVQAHQN